MAQQPNHAGGLGWVVAGVLFLILIGSNAGSGSRNSDANASYASAESYRPEGATHVPPTALDDLARPLARPPLEDVEDDVAALPADEEDAPAALPPADYAASGGDEEADSAPLSSAATIPPGAGTSSPAAGSAYRYTPPASVPSYAADTASPRTGCAENGTCYGDISAATGRPRTVHVRGYTRRDGTYVRSHYRSRPRR